MSTRIIKAKHRGELIVIEKRGVENLFDSCGGNIKQLGKSLKFLFTGSTSASTGLSICDRNRF